jgi:pilus assembly protein CpaB
MDVKKLVLLFGALVIAAVTAITAKNMFSGAAAPVASAVPAPVPEGPEVLVATRSLPVGTIVDAEALRFQRWPAGLVQPAYFIKGQPGINASALIGAVVRNEMTAGQPMTQGSLIKPGERGFLAAALGPGMRAVTVGVSATSSVAGFIFPGDRVDMVLTQEVAGGEGPPLKVSETIMRNIRVLATDNRLSSLNPEGKPVVERFSTVTLEATPKMAEKIAVAQTIGGLSLALRSIADNSAELERAIASGAVTVPENGDPKAEHKMLIAVASKPIDTGTTYTVGADVSRFQRSTRPSVHVAAAPGMPAAPQAAPNGPPPAPVGPVVRIARGNNITVVPVGAK